LYTVNTKIGTDHVSKPMTVPKSYVCYKSTVCKSVKVLMYSDHSQPKSEKTRFWALLAPHTLGLKLDYTLSISEHWSRRILRHNLTCFTTCAGILRKTITREWITRIILTAWSSILTLSIITALPICGTLICSLLPVRDVIKLFQY